VTVIGTNSGGVSLSGEERRPRTDHVPVSDPQIRLPRSEAAVPPIPITASGPSARGRRLIPNFPNETWIEPKGDGPLPRLNARNTAERSTRRCFLRVSVSRARSSKRWLFERASRPNFHEAVVEGRKIFEHTGCINCHTVVGTAANGRFGPDLTTLMSGRHRRRPGPEHPENLRRWIQDPPQSNPGSLCPRWE